MVAVAPSATVNVWSKLSTEQSTTTEKSGLVNPAGLPVTAFVTLNEPVGAAVTLNGVDPEHVCPATVVRAVTVAFPVALGVPDLSLIHI